MSENTAISWAHHTFNPWINCTKVGPGCDNCYAEQLMDKRLHVVTWGHHQLRKRTSESNWRLPLKWNKNHDEFFAKHGCRQRVFCASLADVFDNEVQTQWRIDLMRLILDTPNLDWMLLTKRIGNAAEMLDVAFRAVHAQREKWADNVPANVWLGATICNQPEADRDIAKLLAVPAHVHFLSVEPMLGEVNLRNLYIGQNSILHRQWGIHPDHDHIDSLHPSNRARRAKIDWVIAGGESGPNARPMHPDWVRSLRDQCQYAGVPFHFKQWGSWAPGSNWPDDVAIPSGKSCNFGNESAGDSECSWFVGSKAAGRHLDGLVWDEFPKAAA